MAQLLGLTILELDRSKYKFMFWEFEMAIELAHWLLIHY